MNAQRAAPNAYTAMWTSIGWLGADVALAAIAVAVGAAHDVPWVAFIALLGVAAAVVFYVQCRGWYTKEGKGSPSTTFATWWRQRGILQMTLSGAPTWIAVAIAVAAHKR